MNKKILVSLSVIGAVAALAVGGTIAYFSDVETSTGNTFTAGTIDLKVDSTCHYDGMICSMDNAGKYVWTEESANSSTYPELIGKACTCTWISADLSGQPFFNFTDIKPGDNGENTLSFHIESNPAWACIYVNKIVDEENGCNDPEKEAEPACTENDKGELATKMTVNLWVDNDCDNVKDDVEQVIIDPTVLSTYLTNGIGVIPVASKDAGTFLHDPLPAGNYCVGLAWSLPGETGNEVQSDKLGADLSFYIEQSRNNPDFRCIRAN